MHINRSKLILMKLLTELKQKLMHPTSDRDSTIMSYKNIYLTEDFCNFADICQKICFSWIIHYLWNKNLTKIGYDMHKCIIYELYMCH